MSVPWKEILCWQYAAALDMLANAVRACPDELWTADVWRDDELQPGYNHVWYVAAHTLMWSDIALSGTEEGFAPPPPFVRGRLPDQPYGRDDILAYYAAVRRKLWDIVPSLTDEAAARVCPFEWMSPTFVELQLYSLRHVQEHVAQLNLLLGDRADIHLDWIDTAGPETA